MDRWLGLIADPTAAGSTFDHLAAMDDEDPAIPAPTLWVPITSGQADPGEQALERTNEIRGRRGNTAPRSFAAAPTLTWEARAYPKLLRPVIRRALGGTIASTGSTPAAIASTVGPLQAGNLPAFIAWLRREGQLDRLTGVVASELELNFPIDEEGTISYQGMALYHDADMAASALDPNGHAAAAPGTPSYTNYEDTYLLRDAVAMTGTGLEDIDAFAGFGMTFSNGLIDEMRSRFKPYSNIESIEVDGDEHKIWFPNRNKISAQTVTGRIDLSDVDAAMALKRRAKHVERLVFEVAAGKLGTTPEADDMMRITIHSHTLTGGGAEPLQKDGDQIASFEFSGYVDPATNRDIEVTFVGAAALI